MLDLSAQIIKEPISLDASALLPVSDCARAVVVATFDPDVHDLPGIGRMESKVNSRNSMIMNGFLRFESIASPILSW